MGERSSVGLQVAVDDAEGVQVLDRQEDLAGVEACLRLAELSAAAEQVVQVAAVAKVHDVVELNKKKSDAAAHCGE